MADAGPRRTDDMGLGRDARLKDLAVRYRDPLIRYFQRKGVSRDGSEDCVQDVFLRLARADDATIENAEAYLFTVASSVMVDRLRKARTRSERDHHQVEDFLLPSGEPSADRVFEGKEALMRLAEVLAELPVHTREMFLLNRQDDLTYTQIAARYAVSVRAVEHQIARALKHLRRGLGRYD